MPRLRIAPDEVGRHFWIVPEKRPAYPADIDELPVSDDLLERMEAWADAFDATFGPSGRDRTGFASAEAEAAWIEEGRRVAAELARELRDDWQVETKL